MRSNESIILDFLAKYRAGIVMLEARISTMLSLYKAENAPGLKPTLSELEKVLRANLSLAEQRVAQFHLALTGKYLKSEDLDRLVFSYGLKNEGDLIGLFSQEMIRNPDFFSDSSRIEIVPVSDDTILVDVTHTEKYPTISGIQRVVRRFCEEAAHANRSMKLVRMSSTLPIFEMLSPEETESFLNFKSRPRSSEVIRKVKKTPFFFTLIGFEPNSANSRAKEGLLFAIRIFVSLLPKFAIPIGKLVRDEIVRKFKQKPDIAQEQILDPVLKVPFLQDKHLALIEVIDDRRRVEFYLQLKRHFSFTLTMVCYDLIPVYNSELCVAAEWFINYLRLLQRVDRVSCISEHTKKQLLNFAANIDRGDLGPPEITVHGLAGDFPKHTITDSPSSGSVKPLVLCVGTLEPRKNQLGVLRAAKTLWSQKIDFKLLYVGHFGWLCEKFIDELEEAKGMGFDVDLMDTASEESLIELYNKAYCTIFCSFAEGFGLPIVESLSKGKPCVTSNVGSMAEIAQEGGCILVDPKSTQSIADGLSRLLADRKLYDRLCGEISRRKFTTWREYSEDLFQFMMTDQEASSLGKDHRVLGRTVDASQIT